MTQSRRLLDMDETSSSPTAYDSGASPANNAATAGTTLPTFVNGQIGSALQRDGASQYASTPDETSLTITGAITIAAWIKPTFSVNTTSRVLQKGTMNTNDGYASLSSAGKVFVRFNQKTSATPTASMRRRHTRSTAALGCTSLPPTTGPRSDSM